MRLGLTNALNILKRLLTDNHDASFFEEDGGGGKNCKHDHAVACRHRDQPPRTIPNQVSEPEIIFVHAGYEKCL